MKLDKQNLVIIGAVLVIFYLVQTNEFSQFGINPVDLSMIGGSGAFGAPFHQKHPLSPKAVHHEGEVHPPKVHPPQCGQRGGNPGGAAGKFLNNRIKSDSDMIGATYPMDAAWGVNKNEGGYKLGF